MATSGRFSSDGEEAIRRELAALPLTERKPKTEDELWDYYELDKCLQFASQYKNVALQFPDHLLHDAAWIASILQRVARNEIYILGDTSYGSCCVDEVAASHSNSEAIIHFGPSCLTQVKRFPVLYVFGKEIIDVEDCVDKLNNVMSSRDISVVIIYDVIFDHIINSLYGHLISLYRDVTLAKLNVPMLHGVGVVSSGFVNGNDETKSFIKFGRIFNISRPLEDYKIFYIGGESPTLTNFMLTYTSNQFFSYNPADKICRFETRNVNRMLGHRYFLIQKAKEAKMVGILVGTLGAVDYLPMIDRVNEVLTTAGKKSYIIVVGKLNPAKLANFMEIEVFVLIACSHCSLIDSQDYLQPIITPYELEVACLSSRQWEGNIVMDYRQLLPGGDSHVTVETSSNVEPEYSFLSGHMLSMATDNDEGSTEGKSIVPKENTQLSLPHTGASHLQSRSWKGLERDIGKTPVTCTPLDGRSGLPSFYTHEEEHL